MQVELNGLPVFIDTGGRELFPGRPTQVFIHGAQHDHFVWKSLLARFARPDRNLLAPDLPGHGRSGGPPLPSIEAMADWIVALLTQETRRAAPSVSWPLEGRNERSEFFGVGPIVGAGETASISLAGHSMGSLVALEAAARLGTAMPMPVSPALLDAARDNEPEALALINQWSHSATTWCGGNRGSQGIWLPAINLRIMERQPAGTLFNDLSACNAYRNGLDTALRLACPITLVAGTADRMTSIKSARKLATKLPGAALVEIAGAGHALMAEAPAAITNSLQNPKN
jgi:pimeloyl-ACP methyl ester carboxylesterase